MKNCALNCARMRNFRISKKSDITTGLHLKGCGMYLFSIIHPGTSEDIMAKNKTILSSYIAMPPKRKSDNRVKYVLTDPPAILFSVGHNFSLLDCDSRVLSRCCNTHI